MKRQRADYQVIPYPRYMRFAAAAYQSVRRKPMIHGLLEADVTEARTLLREYKARTGESLSFTAFLCACLGKAVDEHKAVQAFRLSGNRLVLFDDVDICIRIEREVAGQKYVVPYILRAANRKTFRELHDEIRAAQVGGYARRPDAASLPAGRALPALHLDLHQDCAKASAGMEREHGDGGCHIRRHVRARSGLGHPAGGADAAHGDGRWYRREADTGGRACRSPRVSQPDDQRGS